MSRDKGFSLLEVMVALAVLGLVLAGAVRAVGTFAFNHEHLRDKTLAQWVAANQLIESQLNAFESAGDEKSGTERMGGRTWRWVRTIESTPRDQLQAIGVEVFLADGQEQPIARLEGLRLTKQSGS